MESEGDFFAKQHELEAILRRCDHDADQTLSFDEFCELYCEPVVAATAPAEIHEKFMMNRDAGVFNPAAAAEQRKWVPEEVLPLLPVE